MTRKRPTIRAVVTTLVGVAIFLFVWLLRFNDPGGAFAGLTDDHFFYLTRGWQILYGDLPVRDFVDHGAPLFYYVGAAVQVVLGRGTFSEILFTSAMLGLSAALIFWLSARASGWVMVGLVGATFFVCLDPRFYNYPKFLVYVVAIPLLWAFADAPTARMRLWLAVVTVVAFLFRHDHGVFVALAMAVLLVLLRMPWRQRLTHAVLYGVVVLALLAPYLVFIQRNGGVVSYFQQAQAWAERDRDRAPVIFPGVFANPDGVSVQTQAATGVGRVVWVLRDNMVAWLFYTEIAIPFFALFVLWLSADGARPGWPHARAKLGTVVALGIMVDGYFLRSPLGARLADPSVPLAILLSWLVVAVPRLLLSRGSLAPFVRRWALPARTLMAAGAVAIGFIIVGTLSRDFYRRLDRSSMAERWGKPPERAVDMARQLQRDWDLNTWQSRPGRSELVDLSMYVNACTRPTDRVLVQGYLPQVLALARRAFAGGHADLRPGFFATDSAQQLTLARLQAQSVPIILLDTDSQLQEFMDSFPPIAEHLRRHYRQAGTREFDGRFGITLFVRTDLTPSSTWTPFGWPCYGAGRVG